MTNMIFTKAPKVAGSKIKALNVEVDGKPFGQIWTFTKTKGEFHPWHAKPLNGEHRAFYAKDGGLQAAQRYMMEHTLFSPAQIAELRAEYSKIKTIDPCKPTYTKLIKLLDSSSQARLNQLANSAIPFVSKLANNRVIKEIK